MINGQPQTWHYGLVARWWAEFNTDGPEIAHFRRQIERFGQPALDLACGTGRLLFPFLAAGMDVDGADLSPDMLAWARRRADREQRTPALYNQAMHALTLPVRIAPSSSAAHSGWAAAGRRIGRRCGGSTPT